MPKVIAIDFDGCLCTNCWPDIGDPIHSTIEKMRAEQAQGAQFILWTCREGAELDDALAWCKAHGIRFDAVNENLPDRIEKYGTNPRKIGADLYIDDKSICVRADGGENKWGNLLT